MFYQNIELDFLSQRISKVGRLLLRLLFCSYLYFMVLNRNRQAAYKRQDLHRYPLCYMWVISFNKSVNIYIHKIF